MVGSATVLADDPELTARPGDPSAPPRPAVHQPTRIVLDSRGRIPPTARVLGGPAPSIVATGPGSPGGWREAVEAVGGEVLELPTRTAADGQSHIDLGALVAECGRRGMLHVLFEGGGVILGSLFDQRLVDRLHAVIAPIIVGAAQAPTPVSGGGARRMADAVRLEGRTVEQLGEDLLVSGRPIWPD